MDTIRDHAVDTIQQQTNATPPDLPYDPAMEPIPVKERVAYGLGDLASNLAFTAASTFILFYYTDFAGIAPAAAGMIILLAKLFDGGSDILFGVLVDRTKSKHGKARPWLLWMAIPFAVTLVLAFSVPDIGDTGKQIYAFLTYTLMMAGAYTAINIPYGVMGALMTQDPQQRSLLNIFRMSMALIGGLIVNALTMVLVQAFGNDGRAWQITFTIYAVIGMILFYICFKGTKERVKPAENSQEKKQDVPVKTGMIALIKNKYWVILLVVGLLMFIGQGAMGAGLYFFQYVVGNVQLFGLSMMASLFAMLIALAVFSAPLLKKYGKRNTVIVGSVINLIGCVIIAVNSTNLVVVMTGVVIKGLGMGFMTSCFFAMVADTIEYGEYQSGIRTEGLTYSSSSFGGKVGAGLGAGLVGLVLSMGGYIAGADTQTDSALLSITFLYVWLPLITSITTILLMLPYKLDQEYAQIIAHLRNKSSIESES